MTGEKISDKECQHVIKVWNTFQLKTMKDYHDFLLKCDFLFLAYVFEKLRNSSLQNHVLCPSHYLSTPALSWDAMLNMTKVDLKLISDA